MTRRSDDNAIIRYTVACADAEVLEIPWSGGAIDFRGIRLIVVERFGGRERHCEAGQKREPVSIFSESRFRPCETAPLRK